MSRSVFLSPVCALVLTYVVIAPKVALRSAMYVPIRASTFLDGVLTFSRTVVNKAISHAIVLLSNPPSAFAIAVSTS